MYRHSVYAHWRDSARNARFFVIDAIASFPFLFFLLHIRFWTFLIALVMTIFFTCLHRFGYTLPVFLRYIISIIAGPKKYANPWWRS